MDHLGLVFVELGVMFAGVSALGMVARRFGLSAIPLYLLAGLAFGNGGIAPVAASDDFITVAAEIGVLLLLLTLGLEFDARELTASLRRHGPSGVVDLVCNALPGFAVAMLLGLPLPAAVAVGGLTWISSSGIVAQLLADLDRLGNRETPAILSVLVLEDLAMAVFLPILLVVLAGGGAGQAAFGVLLAVGAVTLALLAATKAGDRIGRLLSHDSDEQVMLRVLGLTMLVAGATHVLGASAAVGAFLVGIAIPDELAHRARTILGPQRDLFAALFFLTFGLTTDPSQLGPALPAAAALAVVGIVGKVATGWYAARRDGVGPRGRRRAGATLVPRGEFSIVIAGLAGAAGHREVVLVGTAYVLVMAVVGPLLAKLSDRQQVAPA
ncbi:MAG TPA: cation:proton antiporter [Dermatophilaceae bacterium]|nr:cation:proton antiporter [Dermatophilaceae bacterium]